MTVRYVRVNSAKLGISLTLVKFDEGCETHLTFISVGSDRSREPSSYRVVDNKT